MAPGRRAQLIPWSSSFGFIDGSRVLTYFLYWGLKVAFRHICPKTLHENMWPKSRIQSEHLPVQYFKRPSQIFLGVATLGDRVSVARYRLVSATLFQAHWCGGYIDCSGNLQSSNFERCRPPCIICASTFRKSKFCTTLSSPYTLFPNSTKSNILAFRGQPGAGFEVFASQRSSGLGERRLGD